jgi:hypothetical protein
MEGKKNASECSPSPLPSPPGEGERNPAAEDSLGSGGNDAVCGGKRYLISAE